MALWPFFFCPAVVWRSPDSSRPDPGMFIAPCLESWPNRRRRYASHLGGTTSVSLFSFLLMTGMSLFAWWIQAVAA